ncbi:MAG: transcriptional regulator [Alphaproteobacteria bacterium]
MTDTAQRILHLLKTRGPQTAQALARRFAISTVAARKQLASLQEDGLVDFAEESVGVGRPRRLWSLTEAGHARFPDAHEHLSLELIEAAREAFGDAGLERMIATRERATLAAYKDALKGCDGPRARVRKLTELRRAEGYMAECRLAGDGWLLVENHCPICAAASVCQGFCRAELDIFQAVLGPEVGVERTEHILAGARRCAYRITPR